MKRMFVGLVAGILLLAVGLPVIRLAIFAYTPSRPGAPESAFVAVRKGQSPSEIARQLAQIGAITDPAAFVRLGRYARQWKALKAGEYKVSPAMSPMEIFGALTSGVSAAHPITVREGENMYEIAADLESKGLGAAKEFLRLCRDRAFMASLGLGQKEIPSLEGYLFPDTYFFNRTMSPEDIIRQMVKRFEGAWTAEYDRRAEQLGFTRHQVVTLASIVEKETGAPQERPMISSVFHNRLKKKMRLQSDPTTIYGIWERYRGNIHRSDLLAANDYNTYYIRGLPIGAISNPGTEAVRAALFPSESPYFYFVSHNDGTHEFTSTFEDHSRAVKRFQLDPRAREGKSWRDLSKQPK